MAFTFSTTNLGGGSTGRPNMKIGATVALNDIYAKSYINVPYPSVTITVSVYDTNYNTSFRSGVEGTYYYEVYVNGSLAWSYKAQISNKTLAATSGWASTSGTVTSEYWSGSGINLSTLFNSNNPTTRSVPITLVRTSVTAGSVGGGYDYSTARVNATGSANIILDVPPTFNETFSYTGDFSGVPYANLTTASVSLSGLTAYYGGDFTGVGNAEFIIGSQSVSKPNPANGDVLTIALNAVGTFNPIVKITDSRGQVTTHTLNAITVMGYNAPTVSFDASRTLSDGTPDDEGTYAFLEATFTFTDVIADAVAPSVVVTDDAGTVTTPVVDWYTDAAMTTPVTWSSLSSGDTVYGIFSGLSTQHSYTVSVRPRDSEGTGTAVTQTIGAAFYTVDFLAGGHGIAFGKPAANVGFECAMEATFEDTLQADGTATFGSDVLIDLPDYQTASTTDKAIYDAVVALGWDSDVLVN